MFERQNGLDEARNPGRHIQMSDVCLDRTDGTEAFLVGNGAKSLGQRSDFNGIPQGGTRPVGFDIGDGFRSQSQPSQGPLAITSA